mgnify:FL=1
MFIDSLLPNSCHSDRHGCPGGDHESEPACHIEHHSVAQYNPPKPAVVLKPCDSSAPACDSDDPDQSHASEHDRTKVILRPRRDACVPEPGEDLDGSSDEDDEAGDAEATSHAGNKTILHLFAAGLFSYSCASLARDDGVCIEPIAQKSEKHGNLMDDHCWGVMSEVMLSDVVDAILLTPPSGTYASQRSSIMPSLRSGDGQEWFGRWDLPNAIKAALRDEDLIWLRVSETLLSLTRRRRTWTVAFEVLGDIMPSQMLGMIEVLNTEGVKRTTVTIRTMTIAVILFGWDYQPIEYEDLEHMYLHITGAMVGYTGICDVVQQTGVRLVARADRASTPRGAAPECNHDSHPAE